MNVTRPQPQVQLAATSEALTCGVNKTLTPTASMTRSEGVVSYEWVLISQQLAAPATSGTVVNQFNTTGQSAATLGGYSTTGNPGTATFGVRAAVRATAGGAIVYYSPPAGSTGTAVYNGGTYLLYTVTVGSAVPPPVVTLTSGGSVTLCSPADVRTLTATSTGANVISWSSQNYVLQFAPVGTTNWTNFLTQSTTGTLSVLVRQNPSASTQAAGVRRVYAWGQRTGVCTATYSQALDLYYGNPPTPGSYTLTYDGGCFPPVYILKLPLLDGAESYSWNLEVVYGGGPYAGYYPSITGFPLTGINVPRSEVTQVDAVHPYGQVAWEIRPVAVCNVGTHGTGYQDMILNLTTYSTQNRCGASATRSDGGIYVTASRQCACRPAGVVPPPPMFTVTPVPATDVLRVEELLSPEAGAPTSTASTTLELLDPFGQIRLTRQATGTMHELPTANLPAGPYLLRIRRGETVETRRIAVQH